MRIKILRIIVYGLFIFIVTGLFYTQVIQGEYFFRLSVNNRIRIVPIEGWRGQIIDRNGTVLADNRLSYDVTVTPQEIGKGQPVLFQFLSQTLKISEQVIARRYSRKKTAPFAPIVIAQDVSREDAIIIEENKYRFPSLSVQESYRRYYPLGQNSAHVLGYVGKMNVAQRERFQEYGYSMESVVGYSGVEEYYDNYLRGKEGGLQIEVNSRGQQVRLLGVREAQKGQDITLTIDSNLQWDAFDLLGGRVGVVVVLDMDNGEILSMTSSPGFDPNIFVGSGQPEEINRIFSDSLAPAMNRAITGLFPPGSVFKVIMAIAGLDTKKILPTTSFTCNGAYQLKRATFRCTHVHGAQNLVEAVAHSCNVYFYNLGLILGDEIITRYAHLMGLGEKMAIDLPYEKGGSIPGREQRRLEGRGGWHAGDTLNFSIGQGEVQVTPLQLARLMASVARSGWVVQPHVIKSIGDTPVDKFIDEQKFKIDEDILETARKGLRGAVADEAGTAHVTDLSDLFIAGKTGTAQTSGGKKTHAWFAGYAKGPARNIAFCVLLEHGGSSYNAVVLTRELLLRMKERNLI